MQHMSRRIHPIALVPFVLAILTLLISLATEERMITPAEFFAILALLGLSLALA